MLKLIWRQILKKKGAFSVLFLVWLTSGYVIFSYSHVWFGALSRWWLELPAPGEQNPIKAYKFYLQAQERLQEEKTDLRLMRMACNEFLPFSFREEIESYRPHWLEKLSKWQSQTAPHGKALDSRASNPDTYWKKHRPALLLSLKDILDALNYAYEIPPEIQDSDVKLKNAKSTILLPRVFAKYAEGLCQPQLSRLVWGDYLHFQEIRAWNNYKKKHKIQGQVNENLKRKAFLDELFGDKNYELALREYIAGTPPSYGELRKCESGPFRLSCVAPKEAIVVYKKLLVISPKSDLPYFHLNLARTLWILFHIEKNETHLEAIERHLMLALENRDTELEALFALSELKLEEKNYKEALEFLHRLWLSYHSPSFPKKRFSALARKVLIANRLYREADCFSEMSVIQYGRRKYCYSLRL